MGVLNACRSRRAATAAICARNVAIEQTRALLACSGRDTLELTPGYDFCSRIGDFISAQSPGRFARPGPAAAMAGITRHRRSTSVVLACSPDCGDVLSARVCREPAKLAGTATCGVQLSPEPPARKRLSARPEASAAPVRGVRPARTLHAAGPACEASEASGASVRLGD